MLAMDTLHYSSFYICSILLCVSCLCYTLFHGRVTKRQNQVYILLLINMIFCASTMICVAFFEDNYRPDTRFIADMARFVSCVFHDAMTPMFCYYMFLVCGNAWQIPRRSLILYSAPFLITEFVILMNPLTNWVYYYDNNFQYCRSWGAYAIYLASFFYICIGLQNLFRYWNSLTRAKRNALVFFIAMVAVGIVIQVLWQDIQIELYTDALAALGLMLSIENEDSRLNLTTGVYNRQALILDLTNFIAAKQVFQVIGVQVTNMGSLQRIMGTSASDDFLLAVADFLRTLLPRHCIYQANPSTYVILLKEEDDERASEIAVNILKRFDQTWKGTKVETRLHASIMRGASPENFQSLEDLMFMADGQAPPNAENRVLAGRDLNFLLRRLEVERALHRGLEEHTFEVHYQPVYELPSLKMQSAEALLRLQDRILGNIPPSEFIPAAERAGLIEKLGDFVLEKVCILIASGVMDQLGLSYIGVNLSMLQCVQPGFADHILNTVKHFGVDPSKINFEITESMTTNDYKALAAVIRTLKREGFTFSMDDYGTGYSNMQSVFSLDFDTVRIDKTILWSAERNERGRVILENSIRMIREMKRKILVEGIETNEQRQMVTRLGVDYLQGFYFSKPLPKDNFIALARSYQGTDLSGSDREVVFL